ncbi:MAG: phosphotransferase [Bacillota bacterium]|nr:phosphotransferase [Bacillota bacterium]
MNPDIPHLLDPEGIVRRCFPGAVSPRSTKVSIRLLSTRPDHQVYDCVMDVRGNAQRLIVKRIWAPDGMSMEAKVYQAGIRSIRTLLPKAYAVWNEDGWDWLALEHLAALPSLESPEQIEDLLRLAATFHTGALSDADDNPWLADSRFTVQKRTDSHRISRLMARLQDEPGYRALLGPSYELVYSMLLKIPPLVAEVCTERPTIVHGDLHWQNAGLDTSGRLVLFDWEACQLAPSTWDLAQLVDGTIDYYPHWLEIQDEIRRWALSVYGESYERAGHSLDERLFLELYELSYIWHALDSWLWFHLKSASQGSDVSRCVLAACLEKLRLWGARYTR